MFFVDADCHPQTIAVVATRAEPIGIEVVVGDPMSGLPDAMFGALLAFPGSSGVLRDLAPVAERVHAAGGLVVIAADPLAMVLTTPPGQMGADIAVGSMQRYGVPMGYGGPHAGFMATRDEHARALPGRLVGVSLDAAGRPALRLALQTREQHIRREKATSNVCTAQVLLAVIAGMYAVWHGPDGLRRIASRVHRLTSILAAGLRAGGVEVLGDSWFDTVRVHVPGRADAACTAARAGGMNLWQVDADTVAINLDETTTRDVVQALWDVFGVTAAVEELDVAAPDGIGVFARTGDLLPHPVFKRYHTEHEMLRYLNRLTAKDLSLDDSMIPLGSCTMKLNATTEMLPVTWPEFARLHPFAPRRAVGRLSRDVRSARGVARRDHRLRRRLAAAQLRRAGRVRRPARDSRIPPLAWRRGTDRLFDPLVSPRHQRRLGGHGRHVRDGCGVRRRRQRRPGRPARQGRGGRRSPRGAHGDVSVDARRVRRSAIREVCEIVHRHGGQVYLDGANMNAQVGLSRPGDIGADVCHLNLHKTFCIPHGGGGPGMGPIAVAKHLAPYLPGHPLAALGSQPVGPVSAAPWGSASILPISFAYIAMMGPAGLRSATEVAILGANYIAHRDWRALPGALHRARTAASRTS